MNTLVKKVLRMKLFGSHLVAMLSNQLNNKVIRLCISSVKKEQEVYDLCSSIYEKRQNLYLLDIAFNCAIANQNQEQAAKFLQLQKAKFPESYTCHKNTAIYYANWETSELLTSIYTLTRLFSLKSSTGSLLKRFLPELSPSEQEKAIRYLVYKNPKSIWGQLLMADFHKDNGENAAAKNLYHFVKNTGSLKAAVKLAVMQAEAGDLEHMHKDITNILGRLKKRAAIYTYLPMLFRVMPFYPDDVKQLLFDFRDKAIKSIKAKTKKDFVFLIRVRAIENLMTYNGFRGVPAIYKEFFNNQNLLNTFVAAKNNDGTNLETLWGIQNGEAHQWTVEELKHNDSMCVELMIPTFYFNPQSENKQFYKTLRSAYTAVIETCLSSDMIVIPRFQYNWRETDKITDFKQICYHCRLSEDGVVIQESTLAGRVSIDSIGFAGFSAFSDSSTEKNSDSVFDAYEAQMAFMEGKESKYPQGDNEDSALNSISDDFIFFPLQVESDAVACLRTIKLSDAMAEVVAFCEANNLKLVVKRHPFCNSVLVDELVQHYIKHPNVIEVNASVHDLIAKSKFVITANSGVGLEAIHYGKQVITFGKSDYSKAVGFAKTISELRALCGEAIKDELSTEYAAFLSDYYNNYSIDCNDHNKIQEMVLKTLSA